MKLAYLFPGQGSQTVGMGASLYAHSGAAATVLDDVDAILQVGTNLSAVRLCAAAELWLGKPVIAINTAIYWQALRRNGITDKIAGFGRLLEEF